MIASRQNSSLFSDKEQIWADNASSSRFFGNVYVCYAQFRGTQSRSQPLAVLTSRDGGASWTQKQVTPATNNVNSSNGFGRSGCTVRTDSLGVVYVFEYQFAFNPAGAAPGVIQMAKSFDGGQTFGRPVDLFTAFDTCNRFEPSIGRCVEDGFGGARSDLSPSPSVDIANGAPTGAGATNRIVMSWVDGRTLNAETVRYTSSTNGGSTWETPRDIQTAGDRGYYSAPSVSPDGRDVYVVYNAFTTPFRTTTATPRNILGVVKHADAPVSRGDRRVRHRCTAGPAVTRAGRRRTTWPPSSSATTSTRRRPTTTGPACGTTCATAPTARRSTCTARRSTTRRSRPGARPPRRRSRAAEPGGKTRASRRTRASRPTSSGSARPTFGNSDIYGGSWADPTTP